MKVPDTAVCRLNGADNETHQEICFFFTFIYNALGVGVEDVKLTKLKLEWPVEPLFVVPPEALSHLREALPRGQRLESAWLDRFSRYAAQHPDLAREFEAMMRGELPAGWDTDIPVFPADSKGMKTRLAAELFDAQTEEYRRTVFPPGIRVRLAVEAGATQGLHRYVGDLGDVIGLDHFGASAPGPVLMREHELTVENVCKRAMALLGKNNV